jgi:polyisoprenoid-binding protein YceI
MRKQPLTVLFVLAAVALATSAALAAPATYAFDPAHSTAEFKIRHFLTKVPGRFNQIEGRILLDEESLANSSVEATIAASSIFTNNERRDNHLKTEDFFWAEEHPDITFKSRKVVPGEGDRFQIVGDLTMRGVTKEVTLAATKLGVMDTGQMGKRAGFEATTTVNRKDFGINWNKALDQGGFMLGDDVEIALNIEAVYQPEAKAAN